MRVIVTGGCGFIGSHLTNLLLNAGHEVTVIDDCSTGKNMVDAPICFADIRNFSAVWPCFQDFKPQAVMHLAANASITTSVLDPVRDLQINGIGTLNILRAARDVGVSKFVFASTSAVYADSPRALTEHSKLDGASPYAISKRAAEKYIYGYFPEAVILRLGNVYGPRQLPIGENQVIARMIKHFKAKDPFFIFGDGMQERDFVYVRDVVTAFYRALVGRPGTYNIASGYTTSVNDVAKLVADAWGFMNYTWDHLADRQDPRRKVWMNVDQARLGLNWMPQTTLEEGIAKTMDWWNSQE